MDHWTVKKIYFSRRKSRKQSKTHDIMEPHTPLPHFGIKLSHPWYDVLLQIFHKHILEDRPCTAKDVRQLHGIVNVRNDPNR